MEFLGRKSRYFYVVEQDSEEQVSRSIGPPLGYISRSKASFEVLVYDLQASVNTLRDGSLATTQLIGGR